MSSVLVAIFFVFVSARATYYCRSPSSGELKRKPDIDSMDRSSTDHLYNATYPMTRWTIVDGKYHFRIAIISDNDRASKSTVEKDTWVSNFTVGSLTWDPRAWSVAFEWTSEIVLKSKFSQGGRGMEMSELVTFDGKLFAFDDRTGIVYQIDGSKAYPWVILTHCDGKSARGFKSEWATVKNQYLYVGSVGKEWTSVKTGEIVDHCPMFVKRVSSSGVVEHFDWLSVYVALRSHLGIKFPGYVIHESAAWSNIHRRWFFFPRRVSNESYDLEKEEYSGSNILLSCDEGFGNIMSIRIGEFDPTHGPSSFKFIPGTLDRVIVALTTAEVKEVTATFIMAFTIDGQILMNQTKISDHKYEGFEFI